MASLRISKQKQIFGFDFQFSIEKPLAIPGDLWPHEIACVLELLASRERGSNGRMHRNDGA